MTTLFCTPTSVLRPHVKITPVVANFATTASFYQGVSTLAKFATVQNKGKIVVKRDIQSITNGVKCLHRHDLQVEINRAL